MGVAVSWAMPLPCLLRMMVPGLIERPLAIMGPHTIEGACAVVDASERDDTANLQEEGATCCSRLPSRADGE
jgi:hypothetical protein